MLTQEKILKDIIKILEDYGIEDNIPVTFKTKLRDDLGFDSLEILDLVLKMEYHYSLNMDDCDVTEINTISDIVDLLYKYLNNSNLPITSKEAINKTLKSLEKELKSFSKTNQKTMVIELTKEDDSLTYSVKTR
jgi:acyl carrier protein